MHGNCFQASEYIFLEFSMYMRKEKLRHLIMIGEIKERKRSSDT